MIELFPNLQRRFLILSAILLVALLLLYLLVPGTNPIILCLVGLLGIFIFLASQSAEANKAHTQMVNILYEQLDAERFLDLYAPLLNRTFRSPNAEIMIRLHLSNAYTALGEYVKAEQTLLEVTPLSDKKPEKALLSRFTVTSNLCFCKIQELKTEDATAYLRELLELKEKLIACQLQKPEKKRLIFNTSFNELCCAFLMDGTTNPDALQSLIQKNTPRLERIVISLWTARMNRKENRISEARELLERIVRTCPHLSYGKQAKELLDTLPD